jgi:two-component system chemotaxis response regulator CheB
MRRRIMASREMRRDVVVVGGSAGAIESLAELAGKLRQPFEAAVAVAIHVKPFRTSQLAAVLRRTGRIPILEAADGMPFVEGNIYIAVPDYHLEVGSELRVRRGPREHFCRPAIDPLFRSAASAFGDRVIGVLLSGANTDGVVGAIQIKEAGGIVFVQDPEEARHQRLPATALARHCADAALSIDELADALSRLSRSQTTQV